MRISALQTGTVAVKEVQREGRGRGPARIINVLRAKQWTEPLPIHVWAIEHPEGVILVDTGETALASGPGTSRAGSPTSGWRCASRCARTRRSARSWRASGSPPTRSGGWCSRTCTPTTPAGSRHFPNAEIVVARKEYEAAQGVGGRVNGYLPPPLAQVALAAARGLRGRAVRPVPGERAAHERRRRAARPHARPLAGPPVGGAARRGGPADLLRGRHLLHPGPDAARRRGRRVARPEGAATSLERIRPLAADNELVYLPTHDPEAARRLASRSTVPR